MLKQKKAEDEVRFCDKHKLWYTETWPCKPCVQEKKDAQQAASTKAKS